MAKDRSEEKLEAIYAVPDETVKQNLEVMRAQNEAVSSPSQEEVDDAVLGYPKAREDRKKAAAAAKAKADEKAAAAEHPAAHYKTRTITPEHK